MVVLRGVDGYGYGGGWLKRGGGLLKEKRAKVVVRDGELECRGW